MKIAVLTDTNSGIMPDVGRELGIFVIPRRISIEERVLHEGETLDLAAMYKAIDEKKELIPLDLTVNNFRNMFDAVLAEGYDSIIYLPMPGASEAEVHSMNTAVNDYKDKVSVFSTVMNLTNTVLDMKFMLDQDTPMRDIKDILRENAAHCNMYVASADIKAVARKLGMSAPGAAIAAAKNVKAIFQVKNDDIPNVGKVKGMKEAEKFLLDKINASIKESMKKIDPARLIVTAYGAFDVRNEREKWIEKVRRAVPSKCRLMYKTLPGGFAVRLGVNSIGVSVECAERSISADELV